MQKNFNASNCIFDVPGFPPLSEIVYFEVKQYDPQEALPTFLHLMAQLPKEQLESDLIFLQYVNVPNKTYSEEIKKHIKRLNDPNSLFNKELQNLKRRRPEKINN